ncbi:MAG: vitamin B12-dependent ribonucleotide reductase [Firmicutes bacterium]|nr:vitamin B12-dependent ribonucleotide reductase [Bacillota bacterium]
MTVLERRYLKKKDGKPAEGPEDMFRRVAGNIAQVESRVYGKTEGEAKKIEEAFFDMMVNLEFMPNSPTLMNAGRELQQLAACFVLPVEDSMEGIFDAVKYAALIQKSGGGVGFAFSRLRPKGDEVSSTGGVASGPVSFMKVFNAATNAVKQGGKRRGANMGILRVDHPDIFEFITSKRDDKELTNFNISVAATDAFMEAVKADEPFDLVNPRTGEVVKTVRARDIFDAIVDGAWKNGDPGIIFIDRINRDNPTPQLGVIESTNPCGEQPLLPYEACNLGSINLAHMVRQNEKGKPEIDDSHLEDTVRLAVRFLDDVIDASRYPLEQIEKMVHGNRKIGLGVMGFADMLIKLSVPYDSDEAVEKAREVMSFIQRAARDASADLARERGPFPNFKGSIYDVPGGPMLRNATITTIAPTGTISIIAGCSSGVEPLFAVCYVRNVLDNDKLIEVNPLFQDIARERGFYSDELMKRIAEVGSVRGIPEIPEDIQRLFATAHDISPEWHVRIQAAFQEFTDNAVSKTVNLRHDATRDDVRSALMLAYELGCKGITVFRDRSRESQVLRVEGESPQPADREKALQHEEGYVERVPRKRPQVTFGRTEKVRTGCGNVYVTVNEDEHGLCEVFTSIGKSGGCASAQSEAISRLISLALRAGVKPEWIIKHLRGIRCPSPSWQKGGQIISSCPDAIGIVLEHYIRSTRGQEGDAAAGGASPAAPSPDPDPDPEAESGPPDNWDGLTGACPECGGHMRHENGCSTCILCGYSKCS